MIHVFLAAARPIYTLGSCCKTTRRMAVHIMLSFYGKRSQKTMTTHEVSINSTHTDLPLIVHLGAQQKGEED